MCTYNQYHSKDTVLNKVHSTGNACTNICFLIVKKYLYVLLFREVFIAHGFTQIKWYEGHWFH